eukprot:scaffold140589_cov66-Attheya_sp.AAC.2
MMKFYMIIAFGVSTEYNQHSGEEPSYGCRQGATDGPPCWTLISNVIIKSHNKKAHGSILADPIKTIKVKRSVDMFVDNSSLIVNAANPTLTAETIMERTQNDITSWSKFLWISGGLLELTKTKYYMLIWRFSSRVVPVPDGAQIGLLLHISFNGTQLEIPFFHQILTYKNVE